MSQIECFHFRGNACPTERVSFPGDSSVESNSADNRSSLPAGFWKSFPAPVSFFGAPICVSLVLVSFFGPHLLISTELDSFFGSMFRYKNEPGTSGIVITSPYHVVGI